MRQFEPDTLQKQQKIGEFSPTALDMIKLRRFSRSHPDINTVHAVRL